VDPLPVLFEPPLLRFPLRLVPLVLPDPELSVLLPLPMVPLLPEPDEPLPEPD
jgi:hypothetical protein